MLKECLLIPCALLSGVRNILPRQVAATSNVSYDNVVTYVKGVYNFRDSFDLTSLYTFWSSQGGPSSYNTTIRVDKFPPESGQGMPIYTFSTPLSVNNVCYQLETIEFSFTLGGSLEVELGYYYLQSQTYYITANILDDTSLSQYGVNLQQLMFNLRQPLTMDKPQATLFQTLFTTEDNQYFTRYSGYYTWLPRASFNAPFTAFGTDLYSGDLFYDFYVNGGQSSPYSTFAMAQSDLSDDDLVTYGAYRYSDVVLDSNLASKESRFLVDWKLSLQSKTNLETYGTFSYVRDTTYDDATFQDLLFSIMDSPFYMISRFLNWQLFGVNLFVAFTGLLTLVVILVLIKHFW